MISSSCKMVVCSWVVLLMSMLVMPCSMAAAKLEKPCRALPHPTLNESDSRIIWQFNTGG